MNQSDKTIRIALKPSTKGIIRFGMAFQGFLLLALVVSFAVGMMILAMDFGVPALIVLGIDIFFFLIAKKYLETAFQREIIEIDNQQLRIIHKKVFSETSRSFDLDAIRYFGFAGHQQYTRHTMDNDVVDFTGLGTTERELQFIIDEGTLEIATETEKFRFGRNIPSWDAEDIIEQVETFTGRRFGKQLLNEESQPGNIMPEGDEPDFTS